MKLTVLAVVCVVVNAVNFKLKQCRKIQERPSVHSMTDEQWMRYTDALDKLNSGPRPTVWDSIAKLHSDLYSKVHGVAMFLGWHRAYLALVEQKLQEMDASVMIPFWDWSIYSQAPEKDPALSSRRFGFNGVKNGCVGDGTFMNFTVLYNQKALPAPHCLRRAFQTKGSKAAALVSFDVLNRTTLQQPTFKGFWYDLEFGAHATIHNAISSDFASPTSPNDPIFFSHHAFVDKLWYDWQQRHPSQAYTYTFDTSISNFTSNLPPFNIPLRQTLNPATSLCYSYPNDHFVIGMRLTRRTTSNCTKLPQPSPDPFNRSDLTRIRIPLPMPDSFIQMMHYNPKVVRHYENRNAILVTQLNQATTNPNFPLQLHSSLQNLASFPKLPPPCI
ncbi:hypothetical protein DSO57_1024126 [Entomophthora muscae]|uniref:Uncharacterized protein n=1 Tax=Entomophthora muscae TaxID=34485 RepID=A0ACC2SRV0_9FUNG|nr:hypothetical protein DSO57_1024126 [Entomophthora muscae]